MLKKKALFNEYGVVKNLGVCGDRFRDAARAVFKNLDRRGATPVEKTAAVSQLVGELRGMATLSIFDHQAAVYAAEMVKKKRRAAPVAKRKNTAERIAMLAAHRRR